MLTTIVCLLFVLGIILPLGIGTLVMDHFKRSSLLGCIITLLTWTAIILVLKFFIGTLVIFLGLGTLTLFAFMFIMWLCSTR